MINFLASPAVCVIDEDPNEYTYILKALNSLYVGCLHIKGDDTSQLPERPFTSLRLVFTDLYLSSGAVGKAMASHTANVFSRVVSSDTAPVLVVIWSKHKDEIVDSEPPEDQKTEADLFIDTLLEAEPKYRDRLLFLRMAKPASPTDEDVWVPELKQQISEVLKGQEAVHALWGWESLVREAVHGVSEDLTALSLPRDSGKTSESLKNTMRLLARAQGENDLSDVTAPRHLAAVLSQLLVDQLDHTNGLEKLAPHGGWLREQNAEGVNDDLLPQLNGFLLTMATPAAISSFMPGTVYGGVGDDKFQDYFGAKLGEIKFQAFTKRRHAPGVDIEQKKSIDKEDRKKWEENATPVLIEISPACDVAQGVRRNALLLAGLILPSDLRGNTKSDGAFQVLPTFALRWPMDGFGEQNVFMVFCCRYKATMSAATVPEWLKPWFRLRELPTASLRNWHAGHASRVGYVSL